MIGLLALVSCAYLAAVYLCVETEGELQEDFRKRALGAGVAFAVLGTMALPIAWKDAPVHLGRDVGARRVDADPRGRDPRPGDDGRGLDATIPAWRGSRRCRGGVVLLAGWALAQYPYLVVPDLTYENCGCHRRDAQGGADHLRHRCALPGAVAGVALCLVQGPEPGHDGGVRGIDR